MNKKKEWMEQKTMECEIKTRSYSYKVKKCVNYNSFEVGETIECNISSESDSAWMEWEQKKAVLRERVDLEVSALMKRDKGTDGNDLFKKSVSGGIRE